MRTAMNLRLDCRTDTTRPVVGIAVSSPAALEVREQQHPTTAAGPR